MADKPARGRFATGLVSSKVYTTEGRSGPEFYPGLKARVTRSEQGLKGATASQLGCAPQARPGPRGVGPWQQGSAACSPRPAPPDQPRPAGGPGGPRAGVNPEAILQASRDPVWALVPGCRRRALRDPVDPALSSGAHRLGPQARRPAQGEAVRPPGPGVPHLRVRPGQTPCLCPQLRLVTPGPTSAPSCAQDVSAGKTAWRAREEQEDPALTGPPDARRRCAKGSGAAQPAFGPFRVDTSPRSFVPRPGPLHRSLPAQGSDDAADKESHPAGRSSCRHRNAISSSYSSTREVPSAQRRRAPATRQGWPPPTPPDKVSPHSPWRPAAPSVPCQMENQRQEEAGATTGQRETCRNRSPTSHCSRPRRRKMPLLPHRPGDPVRLPPAPVLGFRVTAQDLDAEKRAALQRIDRALRRGDMEGISRGGLTCPCSALPWPAARAVVLPAVPPAPGLSAQRAEQDSPRPLAVLPPGGGAVSVPPLSQGEPSSPGAPSSLSRPSSSTSTGLAPQPASDVLVTPMDCTPPCQPLLLGPRGSSGSFYPPAQALPMPSRDSMGSVTASTGLHALGLWSPSTPVNRPCGNPGTPAQPTLGATDGQCQGATTLRSLFPYGPRAARASTTARALTSALGQLSLGSATQVALGGSSPTSCTSGTHAGTQPGCAATPAVVPPGTATAPGSVTNAGPGSWQPCPIAGATSPAPLNFGVAAAPAGLGRRQAAPDQRRSFGAHSVTPQTSGAPSSTHRSGDSLGLNTRGHPRGSTPNTTARASTKHNPVSGGPNAPPVSPSPRDLAAQRPPRPSPEPSSTAREATCRVAGLLGPTPRGAASVLSTARNSPARSSPSSAAPGSGSRKRAAPGHKSFPDTSQSTLLGSRRKMRA
eukprot:XP_022272264.1 nuclear envelope pore membrane protein POM 121-like [Canis lupus familiaris]